MKWKIYTRIIDIVVDIIELTIDGTIIDDGFLLPAFESIPIIDVGRSWTLEQLIAINIIIGNVTMCLFGLSFCIDSIAFIPSGVAAPLIPSKFAEIFIETYFLLSSERLFFPNNLLIRGDSNFEIFEESPLFSKIEKMPSHIAYTAHNESDRLTAVLDAFKSPDKTMLGSKKHRDIILITNRKIQILFILKFMVKNIKIWGFMIDTHAHLLMFNEKANEIIENMDIDNLQNIITIGTTVEDSKQSIEFAEKYDNIYVAVGIYPEFSKETTIDDLNEIEKLASNRKVVAIGEIGLDYHRDDYDKKSQIEIFVKQLEIANKLNLPFCIHCRDAASDVYEVLSSHKHLINNSGLMHCYSEGKEWFQKFLDLGLYLSFSGNITYKKTDRSFLKNIPVDRILIETDCPYLSPEPLRGRKNEPKNVKHIIEKIASEIGMDAQELEKITTDNARRFYKINV